MSTYNERLSGLEQVVASLRNDFLQAIVENTRSMSTLNKVVLQQEQNARDINHELTILTSVISAQGQDIKATRSDLRVLKESQDQQFTSLEQQLENVNQGFTSLEEKLGHIVQLLTPPSGTDV